MAALTEDENEFLDIWFPELDRTSYVIPITHADHILSNITNIADVPTGVLRPTDDCRLQAAEEIKKLDDTHKTVHALFAKLKDQTAAGEVMVMMTQASFSVYDSLVAAASVSHIIRRARDASLEHIKSHKQNNSDLIVVNKQRGVLLGVVQSVHFRYTGLARQKLEESATSLAEAATIVQEAVRTVPGADNVAVRRTLILPNITRAQLEGQLRNWIQGVTFLCKDEMTTDEGLEHWWEACWSFGHLDFMGNDVYRPLVARFAIPATRVEIYLTTQPRLQLKHEHDVVDAVGDVYGAEVFQAGLHQLSLFPTQAELLDFDCLNEAVDDVKFLWGPPGTGKTILLELRALQWVKHFDARHVYILQTKEDGTAASCLVEYQLQQTLSAQQQEPRDSQSTQCILTYIDLSGMLSKGCEQAADRRDMLLEKGWKQKLQAALRLQQRPSDSPIHIVADEADGDLVAAVYQWLKEEGVTIVRLWAAGVEAFQDKNIPASLQRAVRHVTEPLRCPGPVVQEVMRARQIEGGEVPRYAGGWQLTGGPPVVRLQHNDKGRDGHSPGWSWRCGQCALNIVGMLKKLHVGEADEGRQGLSANDVFILGWDYDCDSPDDDDFSPAPLIGVLSDKGYKVLKLSSTSSREEVMAVVRRDAEPPAITVADDSCVWGLERKIVVCCEGGCGGVGAGETGRLVAFSRTTSLLIYISA